MEMQIHHDRVLDQVEFRSRVLHAESRDPLALLLPGVAERSGPLLMVCSWCKAVEADHMWLEMERAVERLGVLAAQVLPPISHGICPPCSEQMSRWRPRP